MKQNIFQADGGKNVSPIDHGSWIGFPGFNHLLVRSLSSSFMLMYYIPANVLNSSAECNAMQWMFILAAIQHLSNSRAHM